MRQRQIADDKLLVDLDMPSSQSGRQKHANIDFNDC